jgi:predicted MPP superfamily phosphohydrolase
MLRWIFRLIRYFRWPLAVAAIAGVLLAAKAWSDTMGDPEVRRASIALRGMEPGAPPVTAALISDIHVAGPDMSPDRLARIVAQINALKPDIVLIAGDLVSEKILSTHAYTAAESVAPLAALAAPLGVVVVPGNHDHWFDWPALAAELRGHGIRVLQNEAAQIGPLVIGGVDDAYTRRDDLPPVLAQMRGLQGGRLILTHSPDVFPQVPGEVSLVLAGHTHCGQIAYPWGGSPATLSRYGDRFACGLHREGSRTVITASGLGTSLAPMRLFTQADIWLVELTARE